MASVRYTGASDDTVRPSFSIRDIEYEKRNVCGERSEVMDPSELEGAVLKQKAYLGLARVDLTAVTFDHHLGGCHREISDKDIKRLVQIFRIEGCLNLRDDNFLNVIVNKDHLDAALAETRFRGQGYACLTRDANGRIPYLPLLNVSCLHGLHRVRAAERFLDEDDRWWAVRLYADGKVRKLYVLWVLLG